MIHACFIFWSALDQCPLDEIAPTNVFNIKLIGILVNQLSGTILCLLKLFVVVGQAPQGFDAKVKICLYCHVFCFSSLFIPHEAQANLFVLQKIA